MASKAKGTLPLSNPPKLTQKTMESMLAQWSKKTINIFIEGERTGSSGAVVRSWQNDNGGNTDRSPGLLYSIFSKKVPVETAWVEWVSARLLSEIRKGNIKLYDESSIVLELVGNFLLTTVWEGVAEKRREGFESSFGSKLGDAPFHRYIFGLMFTSVSAAFWTSAIAEALIHAADIDALVAASPATHRSEDAKGAVDRSVMLLADAYKKDRDYEDLCRGKNQAKVEFAEARAEDAARAFLAEIDAEESEGPKTKQSKKNLQKKEQQVLQQVVKENLLLLQQLPQPLPDQQMLLQELKELQSQQLPPQRLVMLQQVRLNLQKELKLQQQKAKPPPTSPTKKTAVATASKSADSPLPPPPPAAPADSWELFLAAMALDGAEASPPQPNKKE